MGVANYAHPGGEKTQPGGEGGKCSHPPPVKKSLASPQQLCRRAGLLYTLSAAVVAVG